ncbi:tetratricopeptide repeat protein [candidate division KSB1 bacterium]|nr:tetratricopeptide repeat protein [candidate division KSB1 bacterium]
MNNQRHLEQLRTRFQQSGATRKEQIQQLISAIMETKKGKGQLIVISGDTGSGKSLLLDAALAQLSFAKYRAKQISLAEFNPLSPYDPIIQLLPDPSTFRLWREDEYSDTENEASETDPILSQSHTRQKQYSLIHHQLAQQLIEETQHHSTLGIFLHAQHATTTFWHFIHYVAKRIESHPLTIILLVDTTKEVAQSGDGSWRDGLQRMNRERLYLPIKLEPFTLAQTHELLQTVFPQADFTDRFIEHVHNASQGLPGKIQSILAHLIETGVIYSSNDVWYHQSEWDIPNENKTLNGDKFSTIWNTLPAVQQAVLTAAAFLGDTFDSNILAAISDHPRIDVLKGLASLSQKGILPAVDEIRFRFSTTEVRNQCLNYVTEAQQDYWLNRLDAILSDKSIAPQGFSYTLLVDLYLKQENHAKALEWVERGMNAAIKNAALWEAYALVNRANPFLHMDWPDKPTKKLVSLYTRAAWLARILGENNQSLVFCQSAMRFATQPAEKNHIWIQEGFTHFRMSRWQESLAAVNRAISNNASGDRHIAMTAHMGIGNVHLELGEYQSAKVQYEKAIPIAQDLQEIALLGTLYNNLGIIANILGQRMQAIALYSKSIPLHEKVGDTFGLAQIYNNIGMTYADEAEWEKAESFYLKSLTITAQLEARMLRSIALLNHALALVNCNRLDDAQVSNQKARHLVKQLNDQLGLAEYHKIQGIIDCKQNSMLKAEIHFKRAYSLYNDLENQLGLAEVCEEFGHMYIRSEDNANARIWYEKSVEFYQAINLKARADKIKKIMQQNKIYVEQSNETT